MGGKKARYKRFQFNVGSEVGCLCGSNEEKVVS